MFGRIIILSLIINSYLKLIKLCKLNLYQEVYMKKIALVLVMILGLSTIFSTVTFAAELPISVVVNDSKLDFPDAQPFVDANGRTQTPAKYIGEALGATVTWNGKDQKAVFTFGKKKLELFIGKKSYVVDGQTKQMDTTSISKDGRIFVPAKYIAEALGANIKWNGTDNTVYINRTLTTQVEEGKDVAAGIVVNNQAELLEVLRIATCTLQPTIVLKGNNYENSDYNLENLVENKSYIYGIYNISISTSIIENVADMSVTITYTQPYKIQQSMTNEIALGRLSNEDTEVANKAKDIVSQVIKNTMTDYEKELAIHDYLVLNYKYDYDNYKNDTIPDESYTPYGLLIKGTGVCQAYAEATEILLNLVGIECKLVTGTSKGESHAWNIVKLDGEYYMLDVTFDDPTPDEPGQVNYNYFNVTADKLSQDHNWDSSKWPIANGTKYNYFIYNNLVVNDHLEFMRLVISKIVQGEKKILVYMNNYDANTFDENTYDLHFIYDYYNGSSANYTITPDTTNTIFEMTLK